MSNDRGLIAVARVRGVEERTSRVALERALQQVKKRELELRTRQEMIRGASRFLRGSAADFVHTRVSLGHMAQGAREAERRLEESRQQASAAHRTWLERKTRLRAVELLLERREERNREERNRREQAELDEAANQIWLRQQKVAG